MNIEPFILILLTVFIPVISVNIKQINFPNYNTENVINKKIIDITSQNGQGLLILTDKKLYEINTIPFFHIETTPIKELFANHKYFMLNYKNSVQIISVFYSEKKLMMFIEDLKEKNKQENISKIFEEESDIIFDSIKFCLLNYDKSKFILTWYKKNGIVFILFQMTDGKIEMLKKNEILLAKRGYYSDNFISIDSFPDSPRFIISYNDNENNIIKICEIGDDIKCIKTYTNLLIVPTTPVVKILNEKYFIMCLRKNARKNFCRVTPIDNPDNHNQYAISPRNDIFDIVSISNYEFVLINKRSEQDCFIQVYDLNGNKKSDIIHLPYFKVNDIKIEFIQESNILVIILSNEETINIHYGIIDVLCDNYEINVDECAYFNLKYHIKKGYYTKTEDTLIRFDNLPSQGYLVDNSKNIIEVDKNFQFLSLKYCFNYTNEKAITIQYKVIDINQYEESSFCNITFNNLNAKIQHNQTWESIHHDSSSYFEQINSAKIISYLFIFLTFGIIIFSLIKDCKNKRKYHNISDSEYYAKLFMKNNITSYKEINDLFLFFYIRYNSLFNHFTHYNPFYNQITRSLYLLNKILIIFGMALISLKSSIDNKDGIIIILLKNIIIYPFFSFLLQIITNILLNRLVYKNIVFTIKLNKEKIKYLINYNSVNEYMKLQNTTDEQNKSGKSFCIYEIPSTIAYSLFLLFYSSISYYILINIQSLINNDNFNMMIFILLVPFILLFTVSDAAHIYLYIIILYNYCFDIRNVSDNIINKTSNIIAELYTMLIPPYIEADYYACEVYSKWLTTNTIK